MVKDGHEFSHAADDASIEGSGHLDTIPPSGLISYGPQGEQELSLRPTRQPGVYDITNKGTLMSQVIVLPDHYAGVPFDDLPLC